MNPSVSVIIPVYNREALLPRALESVRAQSSPANEVIVIDDGSTDASAAVAEDMASRWPELTILSQSNSGAGAARNRGLATAQGDWMAFLDSDDIWLPAKLANLRAAITEEPEPEFVHSNRVYRDPQGGDDRYAAYSVEQLNSRPFLFSCHPLKTSTVAVSRSLLARTGARFAEDVRTSEDYFFFWSALARTERVRFIDEVDAVIFESENSLSREEDRAVIWKDNVRVPSRLLNADLAPDLVGGLRTLRYRSAQELLLNERRQGRPIWRLLPFLARHLRLDEVMRIYASVLLDRSR
ncbi:MAG: glycosyltransferase [Pacificimonas sp.]|jgi:glycosyltransferase involved in cell wall biosynthesis|nr:glycosyltransferase [Pacificimonas sp.]